jgi:hypothetical protein
MFTLPPSSAEFDSADDTEPEHMHSHDDDTRERRENHHAVGGYLKVIVTVHYDFAALIELLIRPDVLFSARPTTTSPTSPT